MTIHTIFGLKARAIIEPQLLDVKFFHDSTALWRAKMRLALLDYREAEANLKKSRDLNQRHCLDMELSGHQGIVRNYWLIYRSVTAEAWKLDRLYRVNLNKRVKELSGKSAA